MEPGQIFFEAMMEPIHGWCELSDADKAEWAAVEAAIRADERARTVEECAALIQRNVGSMNIKARHADEFAAAIRALSLHKTGARQMESDMSDIERGPNLITTRCHTYGCSHDKSIAQIERLQAELAKAREALRFYACDCPLGVCDFDNPNSPSCGDTARAALGDK